MNRRSKCSRFSNSDSFQLLISYWSTVLTAYLLLDNCTICWSPISQQYQQQISIRKTSFLFVIMLSAGLLMVICLNCCYPIGQAIAFVIHIYNTQSGFEQTLNKFGSQFLHDISNIQSNLSNWKKEKNRNFCLCQIMCVCVYLCLFM